MCGGHDSHCLTLFDFCVGIDMCKLLHNALAAYFSGITHKTGDEIHWYDEYNKPITIELIDAKDGRYIMRRYFTDGTLASETEYRNDEPNGKCIKMYPSGRKYCSKEYKDGLLHGKLLFFGPGGLLWYGFKYENGNSCGSI